MIKSIKSGNNGSKNAFPKASLLLIVLFLASIQVYAQVIPAPHTEWRDSGEGWSVPDFTDHQADTLLVRHLHKALSSHPGIHAARERYKASLTLGTQGAALPDPEVMVGYFLNPMSYDGVLGQATFGVMQMFPWPGTRNDARLYGDQRAEAEHARLMLTQLELMTRVRNSWFTLVELHRRQAWFEEQLSWVEQLERLATTRFESGYASRADLLRLEMERTSLSADLRRIRIEWEGAAAAFCALVGGANGQGLSNSEGSGLNVPGLSNSDGSGLMTPEARDFSSTEGCGLVMPEGRPELQFTVPELGPDWQIHPQTARARAQVQSSETAVRQARRMGMPMIGVGAEIMGPNYVMSMPGNRIPVVAQFSVRLPVWRSAADARVEQAMALERSSRHELDETQTTLNESFARARAAYDSYSEEIELLRGELLPRSRELTDLLMLDFAGGRVRLDEVIGARRLSLDMALRLERAVRDRNLAAGRLLLLVPELDDSWPE